MNDFDKMKLAKSGNKQAWAYLYVKYQNKIISLAKEAIEKHGYSDVQPEDLMQKYWIHSIESQEKTDLGPTLDFGEWLTKNFNRWCSLYYAIETRNLSEPLTKTGNPR